MAIEIKAHTDFDMDGREFPTSYDVIENGEVIFSGFTCALDADLLGDILQERADAQAEIARLRGALENVRLNAENRDRVWSIATEALK